MTTLSPGKQITAWEFAGLMARPFGRASVILATVVLSGLLMSLVSGWQSRGPALLTSGALGLTGLFVYRRGLIEESLDDEPRRSWAKTLYGLSAVMPLIVALFLTFYQGLWEARLLFGHFAVTTLLFRIASLYLGYRLAVRLSELTELMKMIRSRQLIVRDPPDSGSAPQPSVKPRTPLGRQPDHL